MANHPLIEEQRTQPKKIQCYGADTIIRDEEEKKVSKHAKRRANKKAKQAAAAQAAQDEYGAQQH